jgi:hypothetical protein
VYVFIMNALLRCVVAALLVTLVIWGAWFALTPIAPRLAVSALLRWGVPGILALSLLLLAVLMGCRRLRLPELAYPPLAALCAAALALALYLGGSALPIPVWGVALATLSAALLTKPVLLGRA